MKNIIQRNLDLTLKYVLIDKKYIPLIDGGGTVCDNCNAPIANIATIKSGDKTYNIGFDCLDTILLNNMILDGKSLEEYTHFKTHVKAYIRIANNMKETIVNHNKEYSYKITGLKFEVSDFHKFKYGSKSYLNFYYLFDNQTDSRSNDNVKISTESNIDDLLQTIAAICKVVIFKT